MGVCRSYVPAQAHLQRLINSITSMSLIEGSLSSSLESCSSPCAQRKDGRAEAVAVVVARVDDEEQPRGADRDGAPDSDWSGGAAWGERMLARSRLPFWYSNAASWVHRDDLRTDVAVLLEAHVVGVDHRSAEPGLPAAVDAEVRPTWSSCCRGS